jgi:hypothetical protein
LHGTTAHGRRFHPNAGLARLQRLPITVLLLWIAATALVVASVVIHAPVSLAATPTYSIWSDSTIPSEPSDPDTRRVVVGTRFSVSRSGTVTHIKFYKSSENNGRHVGALWTARGSVLATVTFPTTTGEGWVAAKLDKPVSVAAGRNYVVSYVAPEGRYADDVEVFAGGRTVQQGPLTATSGVYSYSDGFPTQTWRSSAYYVDVIFTGAASSSLGSASPTASAQPTTVAPSPTPTKTTWPASSPTPTVSATSPTPQSSVSTSVPAPSQTSTSGVPNGKTNCAAKPSACGYPDETNTGVPDGVTLKKSGSVIASRDGQVIDGLEITGEIVVTAPNVVIKNTKVIGGRGAGSSDWVIIIRDNSDNLTIHDSEVTTPAGSEQDNACVFNISNSAPRLLRVNIHGCSQGVSSGAGLIEDSFIHDMSQVPGLSHVDGIASNGDGGLTVRHNTVFNQFNQTAAIALFQDFGTQKNNLIEDNLIAGGGYSIYGGGGRFGPTSDIRIINNRFSDKYFKQSGYWGPLAWFTASDPGNTFSGNYWDRDLSSVRY